MMPATSMTNAERSEAESDADWNSLRLVNKRASTAIGEQRLLEVASGDQVEHDREREEDDGHPPGASLAAEDSPAERDQRDAGDRDHRPRRDRGA